MIVMVAARRQVVEGRDATRDGETCEASRARNGWHDLLPVSNVNVNNIVDGWILLDSSLPLTSWHGC